MTGLEQVVDRDERGRPAADGVEETDQLGHGGHLHLARGPQAERRAEETATDQHEPARAGDLVLMDDQPHGGADGDGHGPGGDRVAAAGRARVVHQVQTEYEAGGRGQEDVVNGLGDGVHGGHTSAFRFFAPGFFSAAGLALNISSIRSVTTYPPTTFIAPNTIATKART